MVCTEAHSAPVRRAPTMNQDKQDSTAMWGVERFREAKLGLETAESGATDSIDDGRANSDGGV